MIGADNRPVSGISILGIVDIVQGILYASFALVIYNLESTSFDFELFITLIPIPLSGRQIEEICVDVHELKNKPGSLTDELMKFSVRVIIEMRPEYWFLWDNIMMGSIKALDQRISNRQ